MSSYKRKIVECEICSLRFTQFYSTDDRAGCVYYENIGVDFVKVYFTFDNLRGEQNRQVNFKFTWVSVCNPLLSYTNYQYILKFIFDKII